MAFVSKSGKKNNLPDNQLVIKVATNKGLVTLGKIGLYNESPLHSKVSALSNEQLLSLLAKAELYIQPYSNGNDTDEIELLL
jgi:hypothetical protein